MRLSFLAKLLLALVGSVGLLLAGSLLVVRGETQRQVRATIAAAVERSRESFAAVEDVRRDALRKASERFTTGNRFPAAVEEALATGETGFLLENARYDLELAGNPAALTAFTGLDGRPIAALLDAAVLPRPETAVPDTLPWMALESEAGVAFGYHLLGGRLFSVQAAVLGFFDVPVGTLALGVPVDRGVAEQLVKGIPGAQVCFVAGGRCVAATPAVAGTLERDMVRMAGGGPPGRTRWRGSRLALIAERVLGEAGMSTAEVWRVTAVPLDDALRPLESVQRTLLWVGLGSMAVAVLVGTVLSRGFARPVRRLVEATERVSRGDYAVRVPAPSRDELGTLAAAFNEMTHGLMLKERYRGVLDKVVSRSIADELLKGEITLGGETRSVTTLFADVRGFTTLTEGMDPARVVALLNEYAEAAAAAVEDEGGVVDKYVGDEVMAVFGAPIRADDHARRALQAAVRIRAAVAALNEGRRARGEPELGVGIGVNTGPAVAGNMGSPGRLNYTVLGESVNVASRLCDGAAGGEIVATRATLEAAGPGVEAVPLGARTLRGLRAPVEVFAVAAVH
ncbi:MAG TPA: adenylate/guanylate cyclase domain-containing protein, partial [Longimicrobiaceae bacterium]|nr:adenylate/guanylate cyclase domain-containing protein [Longimicrobiaceae bacterium]